MLYRSPNPNRSWEKNIAARRKEILKTYQKKTALTDSKNENFTKKIIKKFLKIFIILIILIIISFVGVILWYSRDLPMSTNLLDRKETVSAKIYDRTGQNLLYDFGGGEVMRTKISLNTLPDYIKWSTIVAEDRAFYSHHGLNFKGLTRALFLLIIRGGEKTQGGSSITQQFVKNALLTQEKTYSRKIKEVILAWQMERRFSKDQILEMYFNEIPYGGVTYGIEAAAKKYFGKNAKDLSLAEGAVLAALPQAPSLLSPYGPNKNDLMARKDWILDSLVSEGYITQEKADASKKEDFDFSKISNAIIAPHFVFYVKDLLTKKYNEKTLLEDGLKIITTLNLTQQKIAETIIAKMAPKNKEKNNANNTSLVAINNKTGEITTMVGSLNYFDENIDGAVNITLSPRQPGSSFKPIVYSAAFQKGFSPNTILFDLLTTFKTSPKDFEPRNYNDHYFGPVTLRKALAGSLNIPAVKLLYLTGIDNVLNLSEKMGYTTFSDRSRFGLSLVLGGGEVKLLEHTLAYATLANEGEYHEPISILKIENKNGDILEETDTTKIKTKKVLDTEIARQITSILSDNSARTYVFGEKNYLTLNDRPVAVKTGTTNDYKDAWAMGYTPSLSVGVWVGNTRGEKMSTSADGSTVAAPIWQNFLQEVLKNTPVENFIQAATSTLPNRIMLNGQYINTVDIKINKITGFLADNTTPFELIEDKTIKQVHNILHYINKNNPLGPVPETPWDDENYTNWELVVEKWAQENGYENIVN